jgi:hypothetical protein
MRSEPSGTNIGRIAALAGATYSLGALVATAAAACPDGASWCEDFEHATVKLSGADGTRQRHACGVSTTTYSCCAVTPPRFSCA